MHSERTVNYPMHPHLEGYLIGIAAVPSLVNIDGLELVTYEVPESVDTTLAARDDFKDGFNEAVQFHEKIAREIPSKEFLYE
jgi:hypothetical protein